MNNSSMLDAIIASDVLYEEAEYRWRQGDVAHAIGILMWFGSVAALFFDGYVSCLIFFGGAFAFAVMGMGIFDWSNNLLGESVAALQDGLDVVEALERSDFP